MRFTGPRHLLVGDSSSSWCGLHHVYGRGLVVTRDEAKMSCANCRRSLRAFRAREAKRAATQPKNVTPRS